MKMHTNTGTSTNVTVVWSVHRQTRTVSRLYSNWRTSILGAILWLPRSMIDHSCWVQSCSQRLNLLQATSCTIKMMSPCLIEHQALMDLNGLNASFDTPSGAQNNLMDLHTRQDLYILARHRDLHDAPLTSRSHMGHVTWLSPVSGMFQVECKHQLTTHRISKSPADGPRVDPDLLNECADSTEPNLPWCL